MKKSFKFYIITILSFTLLTLAGCSNANKTLAKNLDNTVTNLIYSVTNLDFANDSELNSLAQTNTEKEQNNAINNNNQTNKNAICDDYYENSCTNQQYYQNMQNYSVQKNMSGHPEFRNEFGKTPIRNENENQIYNTYQNQIKYNLTDNNTQENTQNKNEATRLVSFSTTQISENNKQLQNMISALINKRSNLLIYINDLYKGNISISNQNRNALNAYINIIKDNTAYFNQHRGMVSNQINQAKEILQNDNSSSLVNAYIIRTNEAISRLYFSIVALLRSSFLRCTLNLLITPTVKYLLSIKSLTFFLYFFDATKIPLPQLHNPELP